MNNFIITVMVEVQGSGRSATEITKTKAATEGLL